MSYLLTGLLVGGAASSVFLAIAFLIGQREVGRHRGVSREDFIQAFAEADIPREIPAAVYDYYKSRVLSKEFSVAPDDNYEQVLSESDEDIDDDATFLTGKLGFLVPSDPAVTSLPGRIRSLRDMVNWLNNVRQHQST